MATQTANWPALAPATHAGFNIKTYFVDSVSLARESARRELGENALLLRSRDAAPEARGQGRYEVVFAVGPAEETTPSPEIEPAAEVGAPAPDGRTEVIERKPEAAIESLLLRILGDKLVCDARVGQADGGRRVILLVGPPGAGKTTTLVKLAIQQGLARGRSVKLLSTDVHRVGGPGLLRSYAETLGVGFQACMSTGELVQALKNRNGTDLTFIDTAGYSSSDIHAAAQLARFARERQDIDTHLVLPAYAKQADLLHLACRYA